MEKCRHQGFPPQLEADLQKAKAAQRAVEVRQRRAERESRETESSGSKVRSKSGCRTNLERIGDRRRDGKERERNRQSHRDSGSRDTTGPTFSPPQPINKSSNPAQETEIPPDEQDPLDEQDPPATSTPPRQQEEPMVMSPPRGTPWPPPGLPPPRAEKVATPLVGLTGPPSLQVSINLGAIGSNPDEEFRGGHLRPHQ